MSSGFFSQGGGPSAFNRNIFGGVSSGVSLQSSATNPFAPQQQNNVQQQQQQQQQQNPHELVNMLVTTVKRDVEQAEQGKQWPFSCYSPAKDCASVPGVEDISPEELRFEAYQAQSDPSKAAAYQQRCYSLSETYAQHRRTLVNPSPELKDVLLRIYNQANSNSAAGIRPVAAESIFGGATPASTTASSSIFGGGGLVGGAPPQGGSLFGGGAFAVKSAAPSGSIFGGAPPASSLANPASGFPSIFGGQPAPTSLFGGSSVNKGLFGSSSAPNHPSNEGLFGRPPPQPVSGGGVFQGAPTQPSMAPFVEQRNDQVFQSTPLFANRQVPPPPGQEMSVVAQPQKLLGFGDVNTISSNSMSGLEAAPPVPTASKGLFGRTITPQRDTSAHTPLADLSPEALEVYKTGRFVPGQIPEQPPPVELCS